MVAHFTLVTAPGRGPRPRDTEPLARGHRASGSGPLREDQVFPILVPETALPVGGTKCYREDRGPRQGAGQGAVRALLASLSRDTVQGLQRPRRQEQLVFASVFSSVQLLQ